MSFAEPIEHAPKNGDRIILEDANSGSWDAGLRRPTGGFNTTEHLSDFLPHAGTAS